MPISVTCTECDKTIKVADTMAGKSFKCPGCKAVMKAPAGDTPARKSDSKTVAKKPAARRDEDEDDRPARKPARRDDDDEDDRPSRRSSRRDEDDEDDRPARRSSLRRDDDDEDDRPRKRNVPTERLEEPDEDLQIEEIDIHDTNVPENIQERIEQELTKGEKLYWVGMPSRRIVLIRSMWGPIVGAFILLVCGGVALMFFVQSRNMPGGGGIGLMGALMPGCFGLLFAGGLGLTPFYALWKAKRTCYALTSRRAIVWQAGWFGHVTMENYNPARLANMWRRDMWFFGKGGGDLVFRSVTVITVTSGRHGGVSQSTTYYGFLAIENVKQVERLVREVLVDKVIDRLTS
jgi:hypothetical protein